MRSLSLFAFAAAMSTSSLAIAQDALITVDLSGISAQLATQLDIDLEDIPETIQVSAELAAAVCGLEVTSLEDSCVAIAVTTDLLATIESDDADDGVGTSSAREFAPGQQDGPARNFAPGQQDGDAKDHAPGQVKKNSDADTETDD
jgi:hypothetical protein